MIAFSGARLEKEDIRLEGVEPPEFVVLAGDEPYRVDSAVSYALDVAGVSGGALVSGRAAVRIVGECGRCLREVSREVEAADIRFFVERPPRGEVCDISEDVRTELTLELPMNLLCSDDCRGLCPVCGADLNAGGCSCDRSAVRGSGVWDALDGLKF